MSLSKGAHAPTLKLMKSQQGGGDVLSMLERKSQHLCILFLFSLKYSRVRGTPRYTLSVPEKTSPKVSLSKDTNLEDGHFIWLLWPTGRSKKVRMPVGEIVKSTHCVASGTPGLDVCNAVFYNIFSYISWLYFLLSEPHSLVLPPDVEMIKSSGPRLASSTLSIRHTSSFT